MDKTGLPIPFDRIRFDPAVPEHQAFWQEIAQDERSHRKSLQKILSLKPEKIFPVPVDDPTRVKTDFKAMETSSQEFLSVIEDTPFDEIEALFLAFRIEP